MYVNTLQSLLAQSDDCLPSYQRLDSWASPGLFIIPNESRHEKHVYEGTDQITHKTGCDLK